MQHIFSLKRFILILTIALFARFYLDFDNLPLFWYKYHKKYAHTWVLKKKKVGFKLVNCIKPINLFLVTIQLKVENERGNTI